MKGFISTVLSRFVLIVFLSTTIFQASANIRMVQVGFGGNVFSPSSFNICLGDTIFFVWSGGMHNVHITNPATAPSSDLMALGDTFKYIPLSSGAYNFQCDYHAPIMAGTFTVNPLPVANAGSGETICLGSVVTLSGSGNGSFLWSPSTGLSCTTCPNPACSPPTTTNYSLTVSNGCGSVTDAITITVDSAVASVSPDTIICNGGTAILTATGGVAYSWLPGGETTPTIFVSPTLTSTYTVIVINSNGCTASAITTVTVNTSFVISITPTDASCASCSDGSATAFVSGGSPPYTYSWIASGQTTATATGLVSANYTLCVTDFLGCSDCAVVFVGPVCDTMRTTFAGGNRHDGNMFDVTAINGVIVSGFDINIADDGDAKTGIQIFYKTGTHAGFESNAAAWTMIDTVTITNPSPTGVPTPVPLSLNVGIPAGQTVAFYITVSTTAATDNLEYNKAGTAVGNVYLQDANIQFKEGVGKAYPFGATFFPRVWNGIIHYCTSSSVDVFLQPPVTQQIRVFPNPFTSTAAFELPESDKADKIITLFDLFGKQVKRNNVAAGIRNYTIERGNLKPGIYFYKVESENGIVGAGKIIVQ